VSQNSLLQGGGKKIDILKKKSGSAFTLAEGSDGKKSGAGRTPLNKIGGSSEFSKENGKQRERVLIWTTTTEQGKYVRRGGGKGEESKLLRKRKRRVGGDRAKY